MTFSWALRLIKGRSVSQLKSHWGIIIIAKSPIETAHNNRRFIDLTKSYYIQAIQTRPKIQSDALYNSVNGRAWKNRGRLDTVQYSTIGSRPINWSIAMDVCIHTNSWVECLSYILCWPILFNHNRGSPPSQKRAKAAAHSWVHVLLCCVYTVRTYNIIPRVVLLLPPFFVSLLCDTLFY